MCNANLSDANRDGIFAFLKTQSRIYIGTEEACRRFVEAVLWILRSGDYYRKTEVTGVAFINVLSDGATKVFGLGCTLILPITLIWKAS